MTDVFISHVEEDGRLAFDLARCLEFSGFTTWYYERDGVPGVSYLVQTGRAVDASRAFLLLISSTSLGSHQITKEVVRAHEEDKPFLPVLVDVTHVEFQTRQPEWREAIGAAASISLSQRGVQGTCASLIRGLQQLGIEPSATAKGNGGRSQVPLATAFLYGNYLVQLLNHQRLPLDAKNRLVEAVRVLPDAPSDWVNEFLSAFLDTGDLKVTISRATSDGSPQRQSAIHLGVFYCSLQNAMRRAAKGDANAQLVQNVAQLRDALAALLPGSAVTSEFQNILSSITHDDSATNLSQQEDAMDRLMPTLLQSIRGLGAG